MSDDTDRPRIGEERQGFDAYSLRCAYALAPGHPECGRAATVHLATEDWKGMTACDEHAPIARAAGGIREHSTANSACAMPESMWIEGPPSRCVLDDSGVEPVFESAAALSPDVRRICKSGFEAKSGANPVNVFAAQPMPLEINRIYRICSGCFTRTCGRGCVVASSLCVRVLRACTYGPALLNPVNPVDLQAWALTSANTRRINPRIWLGSPISNPAHIRRCWS